MLPIFVVALVVVLIAGGAFYAHQAAKARREAFLAVAAARNWRFVPDRDAAHDDHFQHFDFFRRGSGRYAYNSLFGEVQLGGADMPFKAGDFHYQTTSTNSKGQTRTHHHHLSYLLAEVPYPGVPEMDIRPEGFFDKVGAFFGFDDIDFESAEFSKKFMVKSADKRFAYDVVHPRMMEYLLATRGPALTVRGRHVLVAQGGQWKPEQFPAKVDWLQGFFAQWPDHVVSDLQSREPTPSDRVL